MGSCCMKGAPERIYSKKDELDSVEYLELTAKLDELFDLCDLNEDGTLTLAEIRKHVMNTDVLSDEFMVEAEKRMTDYDENGDGVVTREEYMNFFLGNAASDNKVIKQVDNEIEKEEIHREKELAKREEDLLKARKSYDEHSLSVIREQKAKDAIERQKKLDAAAVV